MIYFSGAFNFGSAVQSPPAPAGSGVFNFSSGASNPAPNANPFGSGATGGSTFPAPAPTFGGAPAASPPSFSGVSSPPAFGGATPGQQGAAGGAMFSIGAGGGNQQRPVASQRRIATARRTRK